MHNFRKLEIWRRSVDFVTEIYLLTQLYPKEEATSIPLNISEGSAKSSNKDFARFLEMAVGSSFELETALIVAHNLKYINNNVLEEKQAKVNDLQRMINAFKNSLDK